MPIRTQRNLFNGVNPLLHSRWQARHGWHNFHNIYITYTVGLMRKQLLPMGYTAQIEDSLQIRRVGDDQPGKTYKPRADILIADSLWHTSTGTALAEPVLRLEQLLEDIDTEHPYNSIVIYPQDAPPEDTPVAWVELLSPTNKGNSDDARTYLNKRRVLLESGAVYVEIDYLHETPTTFVGLSDYTTGDPYAKPYHIVVLDPRPEFKEGRGKPYGFAVDQTIPTVRIPLNDGDFIDFDFDAAYQKTYTEMAYGLELVDYALLPENLERYNTLYQGRIAVRLLAIREALEAGADLETADITPPDMTLEEALSIIETWK